MSESSKAAQLRSLKAKRYGLRRQIADVQREIDRLQRSAREGSISVSAECHALISAEAARCGMSKQAYADHLITAALIKAERKGEL